VELVSVVELVRLKGVSVVVFALALPLLVLAGFPPLGEKSNL
jgi:hypothetical protein